MIKALAIKELRESAGLVAVAALGMAWVVGRCMGFNPISSVSPIIAGEYSTGHVAFWGDDFYQMSVGIVGGLAVLLGLKQAAWELHHNTCHFLLHRPLSRRRMMLTKLIVGMLLVFGLAAIAIVIYGAWAATPGHLATYFEWSMTAETWLLACALPVLYLGGYLSGIRPGRWFGTRLIPFAASAVWVFIVTTLVPFWWLQWPLLVIGYVFGLVTIDYYTQTRDY